MSTKRLVLAQFIPYRISITANLVSDTIASTYGALYGLAIPEWRLVAVTAETDRMTQQEICVQTRMDKVTVSRAAVALVDRGLLRRLPNPGDRRSHLLELTGTGTAVYKQVAPKLLELEARIFGDMTAEERATFLALLHRTEASALRLHDAFDRNEAP